MKRLPVPEPTKSQTRDRNGLPSPEHTLQECFGPRICWQRSVVVLPVQPDCTPDMDRRVQGMSLALSAEGIELDLAATDWRPSPFLVIEVPDAQDVPSFAGVVIQAFQLLTPGKIRIACRFGGLGAALLHPRNLTPRLDFDTMHFARRFPDEVLDPWVKAGVLRECCLERLLMCPRCRALPSYRFRLRQDLGYWAKCPRCALRFPWNQAEEVVLKGYSTRPLELEPIFRLVSGEADVSRNESD